MTKLRLFSLPCPSTTAIQDPSLIDRDGRLHLSLVCDDDKCRRQTGVFFVKPRAFRQRAEIYCTGWHLTDTYDTICEILESDWVMELRKDAVPEWRDRWAMRHFIIYVDGFGCLEVIAESAVLDDEGDKQSGGT